MSSQKQSTRMAFVGLENAGKTATLKRLIKGEFFSLLMPTSGFNVDKFTYRGVAVEAYDIGGQETFRNTFWRSFIPRAASVVFVIDSADRVRFKESRDALELCLGWARNRPVLMILANKQDLSKAADLGEIINSFSLQQLAEAETISAVQIFPTSALSGEGISDAFDWLFDTLAERVQTPEPVGAHIFIIERKTTRGSVSLRSVLDFSIAEREEIPLTMEEVYNIVTSVNVKGGIPEFPDCGIYTNSRSGANYKICRAAIGKYYCLVADRESARDSTLTTIMQTTLDAVQTETSRSTVLFPARLENIILTKLKEIIQHLETGPGDERSKRRRQDPQKMTVEERVKHVHLESARKSWKADLDQFTSLRVSDRIKAIADRAREEEEEEEPDDEPEVFKRLRKRSSQSK
ncbi:MAG: ADP-ribosylation factor-like protein [Candidatus Hodarchaeota archaeon]